MPEISPEVLATFRGETAPAAETPPSSTAEETASSTPSSETAGDQTAAPAPTSSDPTPSANTSSEGSAAAGDDPEGGDGAKWSSRFAALSRQDRDFQEKKKAHKADVEAFEKSKAASADLADIVANFHKDPVAAIEALAKRHGIDDAYDYLTQAKVNGGQPLPTREVAELRKEIDEFKAAHTKEAETQAATEQEAEVQGHVENFKTNIRAHVEENAADLEMIHGFDKADLVYTAIDAHYSETGKILTIAQAAVNVEEQLAKEWPALVDKLMALPKTKAALLERLKAASPSEPVSKPRDSRPKSITNKQASGGAPRSEPTQMLSRDESIARSAKTLLHGPTG